MTFCTSGRETPDDVRLGNVMLRPTPIAISTLLDHEGSSD